MVISSSSVPNRAWLHPGVRIVPVKALDADNENVLDWESEGGSNVQISDEGDPGEEGLGVVEEPPE